MVYNFTLVTNVRGYGVNTEQSHLGYVFLTILIIYLTLKLFTYGKNEVFNSKLKIQSEVILLFFVLLFFMVLPSLFYPDSFRFVSVIIFFNLAILLMVFLYLHTINFNRDKSTEDLGRLFIVISVISLIFAALLYTLGELQLINNNFYQLKEYPRLYGWYGNPNRFGSAVAIGVISSIFISGFLKNKKTCITNKILIIFLLIGVVLSGSKGALVSLILALAFYVISTIQLNKKMKKKHLVFIFLFTGVLILLISRMDNIFSDRFVNEIVRLDSLDNQRFDIWINTFVILDNNYLYNTIFGNGYGYFQDYIGRSPHNSYIRWLSDFGLLYLLIFALFILSIIRNLTIRNKGDIFLQSLIIYLLTHQLFTQSIFQVRIEGILFIVILGIVIFTKNNMKVKQ